MPKRTSNASPKTKHTPAGEIPVDWEYMKLGDTIESIQSGISIGGLEIPAKANEPGILKVSCVTDGSFRPDENKKGSSTFPVGACNFSRRAKSTTMLIGGCQAHHQQRTFGAEQLCGRTIPILRKRQ